MGGFPNYVIQEAFAATATVDSITTGDTAGNSTATTTIDVVFDQRIFVNSTGVNGTSVDKQLLFNVAGAGAGVGIASAIVFDSKLGSSAAECISSVTSATVVITLDVALTTGAVPNVEFINDSTVLTCDASDTTATGFNSTATDGLRPVFSSAATTDSTTIDVVFSESMVGGGSLVNGDFDIAGTFAGATPTVTNIVTSGTTATLTLSTSIANGDTLTVAYVGDAGDMTDAAAAPNSLATFTAESVTNNVSVPSKSNNLACWGDCTSPTIGLTNNGARMVDGGFSYNGNSVDAIDFHTPFPLISAQIGKTNTVIVKVFDEYGTQGIRLVQFGLGLPEIDSPLNNAEAVIEIWFEHGGDNIEEVKIFDRHNLIENSSIKTQTKMVDCKEGSTSQCTQVTMKYKYREAPIYNIMRVEVMDSYRNAQATTFNDGVEVLGESMNPADKLNIIPVTLQQYPQKRGLVELTQIDRSEQLWTDPYGYIWQGDESRMILLSTIPPKEKDIDPISVFHGYNERINSNFVMYKQMQIDKAQEIFDILYGEIQVDDLTNYVAETTNFGVFSDRSNDPVLQQALIDEANRAELVLEKILFYSELVMR